MARYTPYTYLIGWKKHDKWYYGSRYGKTKSKICDDGCHPKDLWKTYFTSSRVVNDFRKLNGEPDIIQIRKTFVSEESCRAWETKVLVKMNVLSDERWLNKTDSPGIPRSVIIESNRNRTCSNVTKEKHSSNAKLWWKNTKEKNTAYVGNRKGLVTVKNLHTKEVKDLPKDSYDVNEWISIRCEHIYHSPFGSFTGPINIPEELINAMSYPTAFYMCKNSDRVITQQAVNASKGFLKKADIGKAIKDLGFYFEKI